MKPRERRGLQREYGELAADRAGASCGLLLVRLVIRTRTPLFGSGPRPPPPGVASCRGYESS